MLTQTRFDRALPYLLLAVFFAASITVRPVLPVDETRYLSVAWEMLIRRSFLVPTINFEPYFQKPPLLFWLIDMAWAVFGVSRLAAIGVMFAISSAVIWLTGRLAMALFPGKDEMPGRVRWLMLGSAAFALYSSLILFDLLLTACVLACFLALAAFASGRGLRYTALAGLFVGLGVLAKGPVVLIHIACPILLYRMWRDPLASLPPRKFFAGMPLLFLAGLVPVAAWLGPALYQAGGDFAYNLVWRQAAGRVSGSVESAHVRPFYFYLLLLPVALLPWALSPELWLSKPWWRALDKAGSQDRRVVRFLILWCVATLLVFSAISGKQPHYLMPVLPAMILLFGFAMEKVSFRAIRLTTVAVLAVLAIGQAIAAVTIIPRYDLTRPAAFVAEHREADWAINGRYQGEFTFLARLEKPLEIIDENAADAWLAAHPGGYVITRVPGFPAATHRVAFSQLTSRGYLIILGDPPKAAPCPEPPFTTAAARS